jgi:transcriptional regulator with XRE-family HTH domain
MVSITMSAASPRLGPAITRYRQAAGLTLEDCARRAKVAPATLFYWERGERMPKAPHLQRLAVVLDVDFEELSTLAGYGMSGLPALPTYLRKKHRLSRSEAERVERYVERIKGQKARRS